MSTKWSKTFWADLAERVGATAIGALLAVLAGSQSGAIPNDPAVWWTLVGVPIVVSLLKGLLANLSSPTSGPSLLPAPPAPEVPVAEPEPAYHQPSAVETDGTPAKRAPAKKAPAKKAAKKVAPKPPQGLS